MSLRDTYVLREGPLFGFGSKTADALKNANKAFDSSNSKALSTKRTDGGRSEDFVDSMHDAVSTYLGKNNAAADAVSSLVEAIAAHLTNMGSGDSQKIETAFVALCRASRMINRGGAESVATSDIQDGVSRFASALVEAKTKEEIDSMVDQHFKFFQDQAKRNDWTSFRRNLERLVRVASDTPFTDVQPGQKKQSGDKPPAGKAAEPAAQDDDSPEAVDRRLKAKYGDLNKLPDFVGGQQKQPQATATQKTTGTTKSTGTSQPQGPQLQGRKTNKSGTSPRQLRDTLLTTFDAKMTAGSPSYPVKRALVSSAQALSNHVATHPASNPTKVRAFQQAWRNLVQALRPILQRR